MEISNLLEDLVEEIFCKLPVTSMGSVRLTCKKWNTISKSQNFAEKHINRVKAAAAARELSVIMVIDHRVCLMGIHNINGIPSINRKAELVRLEKADKVDISRVIHCDGLLLCITKEGLVVWNPYWGKTRWITPRHSDLIPNYYVMGYEVINNTRSHKILTFFERYINKYENIRSAGYAIYDFKYNSWRDLVITGQDWNMDLFPGGVSLRGNTYCFGKEHIGRGESSLHFLICFDFTRERFGPRLSLPCVKADKVVLSSVREEKLAVLIEQRDTLEMEIWITSEIKPTMVSWSKVFLIVKKIFDHGPWFTDGNFFIEEENKVAAMFVDIDRAKRRNTAYIYGVGGNLREVDLGESTARFCWPQVCSYAPSLVHIE